uniref:Uncharacterized protein n=1 Tax=Setaria italica TaxID=4555 RepID=K4AN69_SETIT
MEFEFKFELDFKFEWDLRYRLESEIFRWALELLVQIKCICVHMNLLNA